MGDRLGRRPLVAARPSLFGLAPGAFAGTIEAYRELVHADDRARVRERIESTLAGDGGYSVEHRVTWPDGSVHWLEAKGQVLRDADGAPRSMIGTVSDATARKRAKAEAHRADELFRAVVEDQTELIVRWTPDGTRTFVNSAYCRDRGRAAAELIGTSFMPELAPGHARALLDDLALLTPGAPVRTRRQRAVAPGGGVAAWRTTSTTSCWSSPWRPICWSSPPRARRCARSCADQDRRRSRRAPHASAPAVQPPARSCSRASST
ncbi:MAG: PAS domain-containing protein [Myxococcota bacterium]